MKKLLFIFIFVIGTIIPTLSQTETLIASDYVETYDWFGAWFTPATTTGYYTDISVTPTLSAGIYGTGNNAREEDWYSLPSVTVDANKDHVFRMRLAAQTISGPTANTAGLDGGDYITVQLSKDGGGFVSELRVRGFSNATWGYSSTAIASKISTGSLTIFTPGGGGDRTNLGDGYSYIELEIPAGPSSIAIDVYCRVNRGGEDWWMDNFELYEITQSALPVELSYFKGEIHLESNLIEWTTQSEYNSNYFSLERSRNGEIWEEITVVPSAGNSTSEINYSYSDFDFYSLSYYRLKQVDIDGQYEMFGPISIIRKEELKVVKYTNLLGQEVNPLTTKGIVIETYEDGSIRKIFRP